MTFDLTALGSQVRERAAELDALGLAWTPGPIHPNYGKAMTSADFEGAGWLAQILIWETGETDLETIQTTSGLVVNKHYDLESTTAVDTVIAELAALVRDGTIPADAYTYTEPAAGTWFGGSEHD